MENCALSGFRMKSLSQREAAVVRSSFPFRGENQPKALQRGELEDRTEAAELHAESLRFWPHGWTKRRRTCALRHRMGAMTRYKTQTKMTRYKNDKKSSKNSCICTRSPPMMATVQLHAQKIYWISVEAKMNIYFSSAQSRIDILPIY